jgi:hypothetical protein|tara:strand:+ start:1100 stop:2116 length:1017 start_codon:yes stop_codon:yes gene_type:complete
MIDNLAKLVVDNGGTISPLIIPGELTDGTGLCNVSVFIDDNDDIITNIRHVHYSLYHSEFNQNFYSVWGCLAYLNPEDDIVLRTGNYLCKLNPDTLEVETHIKIDTSKHDVKPVWTFIGLEDVRVFRWDSQLYVSGVRRDTKPDGEGRMELCEIDWTEDKCIERTRDRIEVDPHTYLEKNWMPILDMPFHYVRWCNPLQITKVDPETGTCKNILKKHYNLELPWELRGGSQVIPWKNGSRICVTHEVDFYHNPGYHKDAHYYHRFVIWDKDWNLEAVSHPFKFMAAKIEFACGLALKDDNFIITYGYQDNAAYALKMPVKLLDNLNWENRKSWINNGL